MQGINAEPLTNDVTFESDICTSTVTFWLDSDKASDIATNRESNYVSNYVSNHVSNYVTENTQKILDYCLTPKTRREILTFLGLTFQTKNYKMHIEPLVSHGFLELTIPGKRLRVYTLPFIVKVLTFAP